MRLKTCFGLLLCCLTLTSIANAQSETPSSERMLRRLDKNKNGTFEKEDDERQWQRFGKFDKDGDGAVTLEELSVAEKVFARREVSSPATGGGEKKSDIVYKQVGFKKLQLDLYYPNQKRTEKCPVIVYTHGGGWAAGSKNSATLGSFAASFKQLLDHGFCVAAVNYRLCSKESEVCMRDCVVDCKDAVRYLAKNSEELGIDSQRFYSFGDSAGGQLAQMLLLTEPEFLPGDEALSGQSYKMLAGVSWYGPCDFEDAQLFNHDDREGFRDRFGPRIIPANAAAEDKLSRYREMSPVNYLTKDSAPLLMIQGDKDTTIPVKHAYRMQKEAEAIKAPVSILIVKNAGHNWRKVDADITPTRDEIVAKTVAFFLEHSKSTPGPSVD